MFVALFTRAWIEIECYPFVVFYGFCRPLYEGVDWNRLLSALAITFRRRPLYEGVDWNTKSIDTNVISIRSPSLRGRGLKYSQSIVWQRRNIVALFTRAWIEITASTVASPAVAVALFTRAWIEIESVYLRDNESFCRPLYEGVDWNVNMMLLPSLSECRPLYEGVDWNRAAQYRCQSSSASPSLRGRGLK